MPKNMSPEQEAKYNEMLNKAVQAKSELRKMLADNPNLPATAVFAWVKRHYMAASYKHLAKALVDLSAEFPE